MVKWKRLLLAVTVVLVGSVGVISAQKSPEGQPFQAISNSITTLSNAVTALADRVTVLEASSVDAIWTAITGLSNAVSALADRVTAVESTAAPAGGPTVVDSLNQVIGPDGGEGSVYLQKDGRWYRTLVQTGGFRDIHPHFFYAQPDCTGTPYIGAYGVVQLLYKQGELGYFADLPHSNLQVRSQRLSGGACSNTNYTQYVGPLATLDFPTHFVAPFRAE